MDANGTLAKTTKGVDEVARHAHGLPNRLRSLLITVDGRATAGALISRFGQAAETESRLQYLIDQGFVEKTRAWDSALLKQIETHFTRFVGPVAKVLVRRAAKQSTDVDELYVKLVQKLDPALLKQIETHFTRFVGPVAKVLVRRAAKQSTDVDELYVKLVQKLDSADGLEFIATRNRLFRPPQIAHISRLHRGPEAARDEPPIWNPALLNQVEMQFTRFVGPVAKVMVRRATKQSTDVDELYVKLANALEPTDERLKFMATQPGVLPPEPHDRMVMAPRQQLRAAPLKKTPPRPPGEPAPEPTSDSPAWDLALLGEIERHFARFMGSSAKRIVRLAGKQTPCVDELYAMLSAMLNSPRDRLAFITTRNQLHVALPKRAVARPQRSVRIKPTAPFDCEGNMVSVVERCCRTCANVAPDHYRAALRCVVLDRPVSARDDCHLWWLNQDVVGGKADRRDILVVSRRTLRGT